jgi:hypothetical protein
MFADTVLKSNFIENNVWYLQGDKVGEGQSLNVLTPGRYILEADTLGCVSRDTLDIIVMTSELDISENLIVYPNPFDKDLYIKDFKEGVNEVEIYDNLGKVVFKHMVKEGEKPVSFDLEPLPPGCYTLAVSSRSRKKIFRIVKSP